SRLHCSAFSCHFRRQRCRRSTVFPYTTLFRSLAQIQTTRFQAGYIEKVGALFPSGRSRMRAVVYISECSEAFHPHAHANLPSCSDRKSTRLNSSHASISYAVFCLKQKKRGQQT